MSTDPRDPAQRGLPRPASFPADAAPGGGGFAGAFPQPGLPVPPVQPVQPVRSVPGVGGMRCAQADRERTADIVRAAFAEGRLTHEELDGRITAVQTARTYADLEAVVADLPVGPTPFPPSPPPAFAAYPPPPAPYAQRARYGQARGLRSAFAPPAAPGLATPYPGLAGRKVNGTAVAAFVLALLEVPTLGLTAPAALICGHVAQGQIRDRDEQGVGYATAAVVLGWLAVAVWTLVLVAAIFASVSSTTGTGH